MSQTLIETLTSAIQLANTKTLAWEADRRETDRRALALVLKTLRSIKGSFAVSMPRGLPAMIETDRSRARRITAAARKYLSQMGERNLDNLAGRLMNDVQVGGKPLRGFLPPPTNHCYRCWVEIEATRDVCVPCEEAARVREAESRVRWEAELGEIARRSCPVCLGQFKPSPESIAAVSAVPRTCKIERIKTLRSCSGLGLGESKILVECSARHFDPPVTPGLAPQGIVAE